MRDLFKAIFLEVLFQADCGRYNWNPDEDGQRLAWARANIDRRLFDGLMR